MTASRDAGVPAELGYVASAIYHSGTHIQFGTPEYPGGGGCVHHPPVMDLKFHDLGPGTYTAPVQSCPAPDGGVAALCDWGLEATLGTTPGTGTLTITKAQANIWGEFQGEVELAFPEDGGVRSYAFRFVAPVCGIE